MATVIQNRGRPVKQLGPAEWDIINDSAYKQMSQQDCAERLGISRETLMATEGFSDVWASKKAAGRARVHDLLWSGAVGETGPDGKGQLAMPAASLRMFLANNILGYSSQVQHTGPGGGPILFAVASSSVPGQIVEGEVLPDTAQLTDGSDGQDEASLT